MNYQPHQQRVIDEHKDLTIKLSKLLEFFISPMYASLPKDEQVRLRAQSQFMNGYAEVLAQRIEAFITEKN
jgi:hypothetical protein